MLNVDVSIIIVNYNTLKMTDNCIQSVINFTRCNTFEIILIDNGSKDGSKEYFLNNKSIIYKYSDENLGFGRANNLGIQAASGKYIFLLNSDTIIKDDIISKLFRFAEDNPHNLGALGTCLLNADMKDAHTFSQFLSPNRVYRKLFQGLGFFSKSYETIIYDKLKTNGFAEVDHITAAAIFIPSVVVDQIGVFDPDYFMYYEETDLEKRMDNLGLKRIVLNIRDIIHFEGGSFETKLPFNRKLLMTKGMRLYIDKHFKGLSKFHIKMLSALIILKDLLVLQYGIKENWLVFRTII